MPCSRQPRAEPPRHRLLRPSPPQVLPRARSVRVSLRADPASCPKVVRAVSLQSGSPAGLSLPYPPAASISRTCSTATRMSRTIGLPPKTSARTVNAIEPGALPHHTPPQSPSVSGPSGHGSVMTASRLDASETWPQGRLSSASPIVSERGCRSKSSSGSSAASRSRSGSPAATSRTSSLPVTTSPISRARSSRNELSCRRDRSMLDAMWPVHLSTARAICRCSSIGGNGASTRQKLSKFRSCPSRMKFAVDWSAAI